ncbi:MAG: hypothetical protein A4S09_12730 [Proteobacteria bacterium SG_bin7]|nr:MAG: hypothetical protein A4S09_12730 [Proteobacteria bacterium SG_bin7]
MTSNLTDFSIDSIQKEIDQISLDQVSSIETVSTDQFLQKINDIISNKLPMGSLADRVRKEYLSWGPLEEILDDESVTEIIICGKSHIAVERKGTLNYLDDSFLSESTYSLFIRRLCHEAGVELSYVMPFIHGRWRDFRLQITSQPVTETPVLNLRRVRIQKWSLLDLESKEMLNACQRKTLEIAVKDMKNILVVGNTGSGKTTILNALLGETGKAQRTIIIEDTNELILPNNISTKMLTRFDPQNKVPLIDQSLLVQQALRMRPDRIVVGEVRGAEAKDLILALSTGHGGGLGTLHAENPNQALLRLEMLVSLGAPQWQTNTIRQMIRFGLDIIITTKRYATGQRKVDGIFKITSLEEFGLVVDQIA